jgi:uncharacterized cupredoxin-like copper-binding protein
MRLFTRVATTAATTAALALILTGCGGDKTTSTASGTARTIDVTMTDNAYQPAQLQVASGETVTLRFKNTGMVTHEAILGDDAKQMAHHAEMTASTGANDPMGHMGTSETSETSADAVTVEAGKTGELIHKFTESGTVLIGCHEPGHWEAGMKATIRIG